MRATVSTMVLRAAVVLAMVAGSACVLRAQTALPRDQRVIRVAVATRAIASGESLADSDIALRDTTIVWRWNTAPDTTRPAAGWVARRAIAAGEVLRAPAVMPQPVVTSGAAVTAIWQDGPVRLVLTGTATNTAAIGAPVGVRIDRTRRLDGIAIGPNTVRLR
jgi:flagella basal body P-ring formation protein FlgA